MAPVYGDDDGHIVSPHVDQTGRLTATKSGSSPEVKPGLSQAQMDYDNHVNADAASRDALNMTSSTTPGRPKTPAMYDIQLPSEHGKGKK